ncbi:MAG TPA: pilus assembly protein TadG-related protein [Chloroflexota bacterium]|nr:pilus assembly protein TadG-related protein [Chloroflexota bacterium]
MSAPNIARLLSVASTRLRGDQEGAVAIIAALSMVVLVGFLALAMDVGVLFVEQTNLQKAVDAAALAGAQAIDLKNFSPGSCPSLGSGTSATKAQQFLSANDANAELVCNQGVRVVNGACATNGCDAWVVTAKETVNFSFAPVLGIGNGSVSATATAIASPISAARNPLYYALWAGNPGTWPADPFFPTTPVPQDYYCDPPIENGVPENGTSAAYPPGTPFACGPDGGYKPGSPGPTAAQNSAGGSPDVPGYIVNDPNWTKDVIYGNPSKCWDPASGANTRGLPECNPNWPQSPADFKGFFGPRGSGPFISGTVSAPQTVKDQGGNQNQSLLCADTNNGATPVVAPLVAKITGTNPYFFTIVAFRVVKLYPGVCDGSFPSNVVAVSIPLDQHCAACGTPGGNDINGPIVVELWQ